MSAIKGRPNAAMALDVRFWPVADIRRVGAQSDEDQSRKFRVFENHRYRDHPLCDEVVSLWSTLWSRHARLRRSQSGKSMPFKIGD